jgi:hypothetical protein
MQIGGEGIENMLENMVFKRHRFMPLYLEMG